MCWIPQVIPSGFVLHECRDVSGRMFIGLLVLFGATDRAGVYSMCCLLSECLRVGVPCLSGVSGPLRSGWEP